MLAYISVVDRISTAIGKAFGWFILIMTFGTSYEVFVRYVLRDPTIWAYDLSYNMYGALFVMAGAYTLSRNAHVRGDVIYRLWPPRTQACHRSRAVHHFLLPRRVGFDDRRLPLRRRVVALSGGQRLQSLRYPDLSAQDADSGGRP